MNTVMTRIIEIEKQSAAEVGQTEAESRKRVEEHRRALEEEKEHFHARIISSEEQRLTEALQAIHDQTQKTFSEASKDYETRFQNAALAQAVKEKILSILLAG